MASSCCLDLMGTMHHLHTEAHLADCSLTTSAGKSTFLSVLAGLLARTSGSVTFENGTSRLGQGELGIIPQRNVLFPELTCLQTLKVWRAIKTPANRPVEDDMIQLLKDCDLGHKIHANASTLSGGQKRKLQLAIGLVGGSKGEFE